MVGCGLPHLRRVSANDSVRLFAGARDADVAQPAFLVDRRVVLRRERPLVRQDAFFHADQVHARKLQALRAVQRHQGDGVAGELRILFVAVVALAEQHVVEKAGQARRRRRAAIFVVAGGRVDDFLERRQPRFALRRVGIELRQRVAVVGFVEHLRDELRDARFFCQRLRNSSMSRRNWATAAAVLASTPSITSASGSTSHRNLPRDVASSSSRFWAALPMPRGGWLMIRISDGSSCGLSITFRYERMSRTSLRSKNDMPPISTYGTFARRSSVSNDRGCSFVRQRMAMSRGCGVRASSSWRMSADDALGFLRFVLALQDRRAACRRAARPSAPCRAGGD